MPTSRPPIHNSQRPKRSQPKSKPTLSIKVDFADMHVANLRLQVLRGLVADIWICGTRVTDWGGSQSLSKQNLWFALGYILSRRALSLIFRSVICGGAPGAFGNMFKRYVFRHQKPASSFVFIRLAVFSVRRLLLAWVFGTGPLAC